MKLIPYVRAKWKLLFIYMIIIVSGIDQNYETFLEFVSQRLGSLKRMWSLMVDRSRQNVENSIPYHAHSSRKSKEYYVDRLLIITGLGPRWRKRRNDDGPYYWMAFKFCCAQTYADAFCVNKSDIWDRTWLSDYIRSCCWTRCVY